MRRSFIPAALIAGAILGASLTGGATAEDDARQTLTDIRDAANAWLDANPTTTLPPTTTTTLPPTTVAPTTTTTAPPSWPGASTTGHSGSLTPSAGFTVRTAGAVIENLDVRGMIRVEANDVTIRNVRVTTAGAIYAIYNPTGQRLTIEDVTLIGDSACSRLVSYSNYTLRRADLSGCLDGASLGNNVTVEDSWCHDLYKVSGVTHTDCLQTAGGSNIVVRGNNLEGPYQGATSAIFLQVNPSPVDNVLIEGNRLSGGSYTVYITRKDDSGPAPTRVTVRDNVWVRNSAIYGPVLVKVPANVTWDGNRWDDGTPLSLS